MTILLFGGVHHVHHVHLAQPCGLQRGHGMDTAWCPVSTWRLKRRSDYGQLEQKKTGHA